MFPKELKLDIVQKDVHDYYKFTNHTENEWLLMHSADGENFKGQYVLDFEEQALENFKPECDRKQTQPDSHFMVNLICTKATPLGRIFMINEKLVIRENGEKESRLIEDEKDRLTILAEKFDIPTVDFISKIK